MRLVDLHDAEASHVLKGYLDATDRHVRAARNVLGQHTSIVHLVNMIPRQHKDIRRRIPAQQVEILVDRVGGALVPVGADPLLRWQQLDEFVETSVEERPTALEMTNQTLSLVLRADADATDPGVDAIGEREVDNAELAGKRHGRLRAPRGQGAG